MDTHDPELTAQANALYWESDAGVNEIAERLDLSKGALYGLIEPLDAGLDCPECGASMEYPNRTALDKAMVTCNGCGLEEEFALVEAAALDVHDPRSPGATGSGAWVPGPGVASPDAAEAASPAPAGDAGSRSALPSRPDDLTETTVPVRTLVATACLALAAGFAIGQMTGRR